MGLIKGTGNGDSGEGGSEEVDGLGEVGILSGAGELGIPPRDRRS